MRLICPRCGAQYEIDGAAIPAAGREVECSACDHVWRAMPGAEPFDPTARPALSRQLSESVIGILREEAARELDARASEHRTRRAAERAGALAAELAAPSADEQAAEPAPAAIPVVPVAEPAPAATSPAPAAHPHLPSPAHAVPAAPSHPARPVTQKPPAAIPPTPVLARPESGGRGGYMAGFGLAVLVAAVAVALYAVAPRLADDGAVGAALAEWRSDVDRGRDWLSDVVRGE